MYSALSKNTLNTIESTASIVAAVWSQAFRIDLSWTWREVACQACSRSSSRDAKPLFSWSCASTRSIRRATILYDSKYAARVVTRRSRPRLNLALILAARRAYDEVAHVVALEHVDAHTGHHMNERADVLAKYGSARIRSGDILSLFRGYAHDDDLEVLT